ncbi:MAG: ATP-binding protein [Candidatus Sabulitectum sp.]|nr:ATP-binding protein [Candidatus Sabulitectum sp.]
MLKLLKFSNVGPSLEAEINFSKRLNVLTGDNGLGKSFLLDIAWWAMTSRWPAEINLKLASGFMATPAGKGEASIEFEIKTKDRVYNRSRKFDRDTQNWIAVRHYAVFSPGFMNLVLYAQADGSFSVWDPAKNNWKQPDINGSQDRIPAYVFNSVEVWEGLRDSKDKLLCNGLVADWAGWQKENGEVFEVLCSVLKALSPDGELIEPGALTRISLDDPRDIPTIKMSYGMDVPLPKASAGMRRIISMAYMLVWSWREHYQACAFLDRPTTDQVTFLVDEIEAHLHPKWQRQIVKALLNVTGKISNWPVVQLITSTHSPMVMASLEQLFDPEIDSWFDLDYAESSGDSVQKVVITKRPFHKLGDASGWLVSEAFDLEYATSSEAESVLKKASAVLSSGKEIDEETARQLDNDLRNVLSETNSFWIRWSYMVKKKGWLL